ncbi:RDD family protein [Reichenbachiella sp. MALMAid0571]|uniref:RDD family protein n=1 Tax=Reichenbachiella sp. MALMAid0571 TaxID=3143939 RepID=UPI0032DFC685
MEHKSIDNKYEPVGFSARLFAYNIDITILMLFFLICSFVVESNTVLYAICLTVITLYFTLFESSVWQGTPGKKYHQLKVINEDGTRISVPIAFCRVLLKYVSILFLFLGIFIIYFRKDRKSLHDIILKTLVVRE